LAPARIRGEWIPEGDLLFLLKSVLLAISCEARFVPLLVAIFLYVSDFVCSDLEPVEVFSARRLPDLPFLPVSDSFTDGLFEPIREAAGRSVPALAIRLEDLDILDLATFVEG